MRKQVAILAITMNILRFCLPIGFVHLRLVLMRMVAKMRRRTLLMLAVDCCRRPGVLERQNHQQKNEKEFFHGTKNSMY